MDAALRQLVTDRAGGRCEYCRLPQSAKPWVPFHIEHILARQHGGRDVSSNLALACDRCNAYKGPNIASVDVETSTSVPLFNSRTDVWHEHFALLSAEEPEIIGLTPVGRATAQLLQMNANRRVRLRRTLIRRGFHFL
jgi:hypothetical protein